MNIPEDLFYTKEHEWIRIDGDSGRVGVTDHAQSQLGDLTYVELPEKGKEVAQSAVLATVESVKAASDVYAPLTGTVMETNAALTDMPGAINEDPYGNGWIAVMKIKSPQEKDALMNAAQYVAFLEREHTH